MGEWLTILTMAHHAHMLAASTSTVCDKANEFKMIWNSRNTDKYGKGKVDFTTQ